MKRNTKQNVNDNITNAVFHEWLSLNRVVPRKKKINKSDIELK